MLQEETLQQVGRRRYEEPDGEFLQHIDTGSNTITVLTRVDSDKGGGVEPPVDPSEYSVDDLKDEMEGRIRDEAELEALLEAEKDGNNRKTAKTAIKNLS